MMWLAAGSIHSVDRLLARPNAVARLEVRELGPAQARLLLEYQAAEQVRSCQEIWEVAQIVLGALFFFFLLFGTTENKFPMALVLSMMLIVLLQRFLLTPELISIGRSVDFAPDVQSTERTRLEVLRMVSFGVEILKLGLGCMLAARLIRQRQRSRGIRHEVDLVK
jgi:hypothetical protein